MTWKKSSPDAVQRFDALVAVEGAKRGLLFGCPIYVLEGERYATLYQDKVVLRLSPANAADLKSRGGYAFEPIKGRKSRDRVVLPDSRNADGKLCVTVHEDTPAAKAIREAMTAVYP